MNNSLAQFPGGTEASKFNEVDLISIIEWSLPKMWRQKFDLDNYVPTEDTKTRFIQEMEAVERNLGHGEEDDERRSENKNKKKEKANSARDGSKSGRDKNNGFWCKRCKRNGTHNTDTCRHLQRERAGETKKEEKEKSKPFTKRTFRNEANAIARLAAKKGSLKILAKSLERQQSREKKAAAKKKKAKSDVADTSSDSESDESINVIGPAPRKTVRFLKKGKLGKNTAQVKSVEDPFADESDEEKLAIMKEKVARRQKELAEKRRQKKDAATAKESALLEDIQEKEKMDVDEKGNETESDMDEN